MDTIELFKKIDSFLKEGQKKQLIVFLESEWDNLSVPKEVHENSFHIASFLIDNSIKEMLYDNAEKWGEIIQTCDLERHDSGQREFLYAKTKYHLGKFDEAMEWMKIANKKSKGRCFKGQNKEYEDFFNKNYSK